MGSALTAWSQSQSLSFYSINTGCCADEVQSSVGARYDIERFGALEQTEPEAANLLLINGMVTEQAALEIQKIYDRMPRPKYVIAVGACASNRGLFCQKGTDATARPVDRIIPVDIYVPGCPPRPEAILNGLIALQEKIQSRLEARDNNAD